MARDVETLVLQMSADVRRMEKELQRGNAVAQRKMNEIERAALASNRKLARIYEEGGRTVVSGMRNALAGLAPLIAGALSVGAVVKYGDAYTSLQNRLKAAGLEGARLAAVEDQLYAAANRGGVAIDAVAQMYQRVSQSRKSLGASDAELISLTNGVTAALQVQGISAQAASGPLLQLGQALGGGTVRAEELNSLLEGTPILLDAAAKGSARFGGDMAKLSNAIREGKVSSQEFFQALLSGLPALEAQAASMPKTVSQAFQILDNQLGRFVGTADASLSATQRLAGGIVYVADNLDSLKDGVIIVAAALGATLASRAIGSAIVSFTAFSASIAASNVQLAAITGQAGLFYTRTTIGSAAAASAVRGLNGAMAFLGGPIGLAIIALASGIALLAVNAGKAEREAQALAETIEQQAKAAGAAAAETAALTGEITDTERWAASLTGQVHLLADAHFRQAAAAKAAAIETAGLRLENARKTLDEAAPAFQRRLSRERGAAGATLSSGARSGITATGQPLGDEYGAAATRAVGSTEYANVRTATATVQALTTNLRQLIARPLEQYVPTAAGGTAATDTGRTGRGGSGGRSGPSPEDLAAQREMLALQAQVELLRAEGRTADAAAGQRQIDILNLTKTLSAAGVEDAQQAATVQVDNLLNAEAAAKGRAAAAERSKVFEEAAIEAQRKQNDVLLDQIGFRAELARLAGDPMRIEAAERDLFIEQRINELLGDRPGLIEESERARAREQAAIEYDALDSADREGRMRDQFRASFRDGIKAAIDGDMGGFFENLADRFTSRMLDNLADDLFDLLSQAAQGFKAGGGSGGWIADLFKAMPKFAAGGRISGPGTGTSDSIPIMASNGEFIVNAEAARAFAPLLVSINKGRLPAFAAGGLITTNEAGREVFAA